jgi:hypothetical protein
MMITKRGVTVPSPETSCQQLLRDLLRPHLSQVTLDGLLSLFDPLGELPLSQLSVETAAGVRRRLGRIARHYLEPGPRDAVLGRFNQLLQAAGLRLPPEDLTTVSGISSPDSGRHRVPELPSPSFLVTPSRELAAIAASPNLPPIHLSFQRPGELRAVLLWAQRTLDGYFKDPAALKRMMGELEQAGQQALSSGSGELHLETAPQGRLTFRIQGSDGKSYCAGVVSTGRG